MNCFGAEADEHTDVCFEDHRTSGVAFSNSNRFSKVYARGVERWRRRGPLAREQSHALY